MPIKVFIVNDQNILKNGLMQLPKNQLDIIVVGETDDVSDCYEKIFNSGPGILIVDSNNKDMGEISNLINSLQENQIKCRPLFKENIDNNDENVSDNKQDNQRGKNFSACFYKCLFEQMKTIQVVYIHSPHINYPPTSCLILSASSRVNPCATISRPPRVSIMISANKTCLSTVILPMAPNFTLVSLAPMSLGFRYIRTSSSSSMIISVGNMALPSPDTLHASNV